MKAILLLKAPFVSMDNFWNKVYLQCRFQWKITTLPDQVPSRGKIVTRKILAGLQRVPIGAKTHQKKANSQILSLETINYFIFPTVDTLQNSKGHLASILLHRKCTLYTLYTVHWKSISYKFQKTSSELRLLFHQSFDFLELPTTKICLLLINKNKLTRVANN